MQSAMLLKHRAPKPINYRLVGFADSHFDRMLKITEHSLALQQ